MQKLARVEPGRSTHLNGLKKPQERCNKNKSAKSNVHEAKQVNSVKGTNLEVNRKNILVGDKTARLL